MEAFFEELPILCAVHESLSIDTVQPTVHPGWGNGLSMADALILQAFLDEGVNRILTTDHDLAAYEGGPEVEVL